MNFTAIDSRDLVTLVASSISDAVIRGDIKPGERLNEVHLAREFDVSRAPVREALRRLESQGLVEAHPRRGFFMTKLTVDGIADLFELRLALETAAGQKVALNCTAADLARIEKQHQAMCRAAERGDLALMTEEDFRFHRLICELSGNKLLLQYFDQIASRVRFCIVHLRSMHEDIVALAQSHAPLIEALRQRRPDDYVTALTRHLDDAQAKLTLGIREGFQEA